MNLVAATPRHAAALAAIHAAAFPPGERWGSDAMAMQLALPGAFGWIAAAGGLALARVAADEAEILSLAVVPALRGRGMGRALLERAAATAGERGARVLFLEVAVGNAAARRTYAVAEFVQVGRRAGYYLGGDDALVLRRALTPCGAAGG